MINEYENLLRTIILLVLGEKDDAPFGVTAERIANWKERREIEVRKRHDSNLEERLIYYSDFYDLKNIIDKNWERFKPILHNKKRFEAFFSEIETHRDTIAHGREILSFQKSIISGIIGDLKNLIVFYYSKNMNPDDYFIKILRISDSLDNIYEPSNYLQSVVTKCILRVGDEIEFTVDAFDPKGREIEYVLERMHNEKVFNKNQFTIKITPTMVSQSHGIFIGVRTRAEYKNEDWVLFSYIVLP